MENKNVNNNIKREKAFAFSGNPDELIAKYDLFGEDSRSLYLLNAELKARA